MIIGNAAATNAAMHERHHAMRNFQTNELPTCAMPIVYVSQSADRGKQTLKKDCYTLCRIPAKFTSKKPGMNSKEEAILAFCCHIGKLSVSIIYEYYSLLLCWRKTTGSSYRK